MRTVQLKQAKRLVGAATDAVTKIDDVRGYMLQTQVAKGHDLRSYPVAGQTYTALEVMDEARRICVVLGDMEFSPSAIVPNSALSGLEGASAKITQSIDALLAGVQAIRNEKRPLSLTDGPAVVARESNEFIYNFGNELPNLAAATDEFASHLMALSAGLRLRRKADPLERESLRADARDIGTLTTSSRDKAKQLSEAAATAEESLKAITDLRSSTDAVSREFLDKATTHRSEIDAALESVRTKAQELDASIQVANEKSGQIATILNAVKTSENLLSGVTKRLTEADERFSQIEETYNKHEEERASSLNLVKELIEKSNDMLDGATIKGLATAFHIERGEIDTRLFWAMVSFLFGIFLLLVFSSVLVAYVLGIQSIGPITLIPAGSTPDIGSISPEGVIARSLVLMAPFWLTWFSARRYMRLFDLRQKYSHKYNLAFSVNNFKKQSPKFEEEIAAVVFSYIAESPVDSKKNAYLAENPLTRLRDAVWASAAGAVGLDAARKAGGDD